MNRPTDCGTRRRAIDAHFDGRGDPDDSQGLFAHLPSCKRCSDYYERRLLLAELDPRASSPRERMARGLGVRPRRRWPVLMGGAMVLAAACLLLLLPRIDDGITARGSAASSLLAYRVRRGAAPERLTTNSRIQRSDELAFAYSNPEGYSRLMVFAVDEQRRVYWYHPAWTDAASDPPAIFVQHSASVIELGEAVAHRLEGQTLTLYGLFTRDAPTVRAVEAMIARQALPSEGVRIVRYAIEVE